MLLLMFIPVIGQAKTQFLSEKSILQAINQKNLLVQEAQTQISSSEQFYDMTRGVYDTVLSAELNYQKNKSERSNAIFGTENSSSQATLGVMQALPTGSQFQFNVVTTKETTNSAFASSPELFEERAELSFLQPLLKNGFGFQSRQQTAQAKENITASQWGFQSSIKKLSRDAGKLYWQWRLLTFTQTFEEQTAQLYSKILSQNKQKLVYGQKSDSDIAALQAQYDLARVSALNAQTQATPALASLLNIIQDQPDSLMDYKPVSVEPAPKFKSLSTESLTAKALEQHPEIQKLKSELKAQNIALALSKNSTLPRLDLKASLALNGIDSDYNTAVSDVGDGHPVWAGGILLSYPLQNRNAKASRDLEKIKESRLLLQLARLERDVEHQIESTVLNLKQAQKKLNLLSSALQSSQIVVDDEIEKYKQGRSDSDRVIQAQTNLLNVKKSQMQTLCDTHAMLLDLDYWTKDNSSLAEQPSKP